MSQSIERPAMTDNLPPLQREREVFEAKFLPPSGVTWVGDRYEVSESRLDSYRCDRFVGQWESWKARAAIEADRAARGDEPAGLVMVNAGALQMVINALRRDASEGRPVRGEMADELFAAPQQVAQPSEQYTDLMKFYGVSDLASLADAQQKHIEKLQTKLPRNDPPAFTRVREG